MIVYNVTVKINAEVQEEWLRWMRETHIPDVMATGMFQSYSLNRIISLEDADGASYAIQYHCPDMATFHKYQLQHAPQLQKDHTERYKDQFVAFRTLMEVIDRS